MSYMSSSILLRPKRLLLQASSILNTLHAQSVTDPRPANFLMVWLLSVSLPYFFFSKAELSASPCVLTAPPLG